MCMYLIKKKALSQYHVYVWGRRVPHNPMIFREAIYVTKEEQGTLD